MNKTKQLSSKAKGQGKAHHKDPSLKKKLHNISVIIQYHVYCICKFPFSKEKAKLEDLVLDLRRNCTYIQKCALNATFVFASADGCIKTKNFCV